MDRQEENNIIMTLPSLKYSFQHILFLLMILLLISYAKQLSNLECANGIQNIKI